MRRLKKVMAALLAGILIMGSVNVMPAEAGVSQDEINVLVQEDFEEGDELIFTPSTGVGLSLGVDTTNATNNSLICANTTGSTGTITYSASEAITSGTVWVEFCVLAPAGVIPSNTFNVLATKTSWATRTVLSSVDSSRYVKSNEQTLGRIYSTVWTKLSYAINLDTKSYMVYTSTYDAATDSFIEHATTQSGTFNDDGFQNIIIQIGSHASRTIYIDNMSVYVCNEQVDIFAEPTGITLNKSKLSSLSVGDTVDLTATVETNGIIPEIEWESANDNVATVEDGKVTAVGKGQTTITAKVGNVEATCVVMVGIADVIMKQDFEDATVGELGFTPDNGVNISIKKEEGSDNCYMQCLQNNTTGSAGTLAYSTNEAITSGTVWVEMCLLAPASALPGNSLNILTTKTNWATRTVLASVDNTRYVSSNGQQLGRLYSTVWTKLSFAINLDTKSYMVYTSTYDAATDSFIEHATAQSGTFNDDGFQNIIIQVPAASNSPSRPVYIDNMAVYTCGEKVNVFAPEVKGTNLSLDGNVGVNFHADLGGYVGKEYAYMKLTLPNGNEKQVKFTDVEKDEETGYYKFACEVAAKEMTEDIKVQIYEGNREMVEPVFFSVYQNASYIIENASSDIGYAKAEPLVRALLNYGAYAQKRFEYNIENLANVKYEDETIGTVSTEEMEHLAAYAYVPTDDMLEIGKVAGASLSLNSETALSFYFTLAEGVNVIDLTFTCEGKQLTPIKSGGMYYVKVDNISASELDGKYTVDVTDSSGNTLSASYAALAYVYNVLSLADDSADYSNVTALKNVVHALYRYNQAANTYFEQ